MERSETHSSAAAHTLTKLWIHTIKGYLDLLRYSFHCSIAFRLLDNTVKHDYKVNQLILDFCVQFTTYFGFVCWFLLSYFPYLLSKK